MVNQNIFRNRYCHIVIIVLFLYLFSGCKGLLTRGLRFQVISYGNGLNVPPEHNYLNPEPDIVILTKPEDIDTPPDNLIYPADLSKLLHSIDFEHNLVIILFSGFSNSTTSKSYTDILGFSRYKDEVNIHIHFNLPVSGRINPATSSPYTVVSVDKTGKWKSDIRFILNVDDVSVKEHRLFVP